MNLSVHSTKTSLMYAEVEDPAEPMEVEEIVEVVDSPQGDGKHFFESQWRVECPAPEIPPSQPRPAEPFVSEPGLQSKDGVDVEVSEGVEVSGGEVAANEDILQEESGASGTKGAYQDLNPHVQLQSSNIKKTNNPINLV